MYFSSNILANLGCCYSWVRRSINLFQIIKRFLHRYMYKSYIENTKKISKLQGRIILTSKWNLKREFKYQHSTAWRSAYCRLESKNIFLLIFNFKVFLRMKHWKLNQGKCPFYTKLWKIFLDFADICIDRGQVFPFWGRERTHEVSRRFNYR